MRRALRILGKLFRFLKTIVWLLIVLMLSLTVGLTAHGAIVGYFAQDGGVFGWSCAIFFVLYLWPSGTFKLAIMVFGTAYAWVIRFAGTILMVLMWCAGIVMFIVTAASGDLQYGVTGLFLILYGVTVRGTFTECFALFVELMFHAYAWPDKFGPPEIPERPEHVVPDSRAAQAELDASSKAARKRR